RRADGTTEEFPETMIGLPLGVVPGMTFEVARRTLQPGETIVIYTDGVSEAMNPASDLYGVERLRETIMKSSPEPATRAQSALLDVQRHAHGRPQNDDITLMVCGRTATA